MKTILILFTLLVAVPCAAQWKYEGNLEAVAFGDHDTSFFESYNQAIGRINPKGEADTGINFSRGNIMSFASLGEYFFGNETGTDAVSFETTNNGSVWHEYRQAFIATNGHNLYGQDFRFAGTQLYYWASMSRDSGVTWDSVADFNPIGFAATGICIYSSTGSSLWRSLDTGAMGSWSQLPAAPFLGTMLTMDSLLFMYQNYRSGGNGRLIVSHDSGMTWDTVHIDSAGVPEFITTLATDGKNLFAGGVHNTGSLNHAVNLSNGFYFSTDAGKTWSVKNDGLTTTINIEAIGIYAYDSTIFISTNNNIDGENSNPIYAVYHRPLKDIVDSTPSNVVQAQQPSDSIEIYPNPSLGTFSIQSSEPIVSVQVRNVLGEQVSSTEYRVPSGGLETLDLSKGPAGIYFLQIQTLSGIVLKKVTIAK